VGWGVSPTVALAKVVLKGAIRSKSPELWGPGSQGNALERAAVEVLLLTATCLHSAFPREQKGITSHHYNPAKLPPRRPLCSQEGQPPLTALQEDRNSGGARNRIKHKQQAKILPYRPENLQNAI